MKKILLIAILFSGLTIVNAQREPAPIALPEVPSIDELPEGVFVDEDVKKNEQVFLKRLNSELKVMLQSVKELDKDRYYEMLREAYFSSMEHFWANKDEKRLVERQRRINELEMKSQIIGIKYEMDKKSNKNKLEGELRTLLTQLFDLKEEQRKDDIVRIESELEKLKESIAVRKQHKEEIINERLRELIGKNEYLDWD